LKLGFFFKTRFLLILPPGAFLANPEETGVRSQNPGFKLASL